jgi:hypothetical protein
VKAAALVLLSFAAGCARGGSADPESDADDAIRVVAVLPLIDRTGCPGFDPDESGEILASQLTKFGVRVVRPRELRAASSVGGAVRTAAEAVSLALKVHADAVLACAVTAYDPYDPPRMAVRTQFLRVTPGAMSGGDIDRLLHSPSWSRGPLALSRDGAPHALAAFEEVYDARDRRLRSALESYAREQGADDSAFPGARDILAVWSKYFEFVSYLILRRTFDTVSGHGT